MSTAVADIHEVPAESRVNYLNASYGIKSWLFTTDHKRIALLYLASITLMFFVGGTAAVLMRLHLIEPQGALVAAGDLQQTVLDARHRDGVFLPDSVDSGDARKFSCADDDRRARPGVSRN